MAEDAKTKEKALPEEIKELERMLEEKRRVLAEQGKEQRPKEIFREAFREKYKAELAPPLPPHAPRSVPASPLAKARGTARAKAEEELQTLVGIAFEKGVRAAITIAKRESPWLLDELHDRLIDEYYEKLVQAKQIQKSS